MGRTISTDLAAILADPARLMNWTVDITLPNATVYRFATAPLTLSGNTYTNDVESVQEIRQVLGGPIDRVKLALQNKDGVLGLDVQANPDQWRRAEAVIKRYYQSVDLSLDEWVPMFSGTFQQPMVTDLQTTTDIVSDVASAGLIVVTRSLAPACPFRYKHAGTCGSTSSDPTCNHQLKSPGGCDGKANTHHFGGCEHRYPITRDVPGTGGNTGGGGFDCPRLDQYTRVRGSNGDWVPKMVRLVTEDDWLWHPILRKFYKVKFAKVLHGVSIWELVTRFGGVGYSSYRHQIIRTTEDAVGLPITKLKISDAVLGVEAENLVDTNIVIAQDTGELGDVMWLEMDAPTNSEKIYCYGNDQNLLIACHNSKPIDPI